MSIYIHGMEMPKSCAWCPLATGCYCAATEEGQYIGVHEKEKTKPDWCPLVEVKPHGRLIDADALAAFAESNAEKYPSWRFSGGGLAVICRDAKLTPTIIPADPAEEEPT